MFLKLFYAIEKRNFQILAHTAFVGKILSIIVVDIFAPCRMVKEQSLSKPDTEDSCRLGWCISLRGWTSHELHAPSSQKNEICQHLIYTFTLK